MMLEEQLKKFSFFKYTGGYSVKKGSREVVESVNYTAQLLSQKENMVMLFPQGSIQNMVVKEMVFESGIETILKRCTTDVQVVFVVNRTEYYSNPKPTWYSTVREYKGSLDTESMQQAYNELYRNCMEPTLTEIE